MIALAPSPEPAPDRTPRHDGLTPARREEFLETLAATGSITDAAAAIGISRTALYRMRQHDAAFAERWTAALREATAVLADDAFERAVKGTSEPVWYKGEQIGARVRHNDRMVMFLLRSHDPETYARPSEPRSAAAPRQASAPGNARSRTPRSPRLGANFVNFTGRVGSGDGRRHLPRRTPPAQGIATASPTPDQTQRPPPRRQGTAARRPPYLTDAHLNRHASAGWHPCLSHPRHFANCENHGPRLRWGDGRGAFNKLRASRNRVA